MDKLSLKDISVIIPTINRVGDLKITLKSFYSKIKYLKEVLIVDQSQNDETKEYALSLKNKKIIYLKSDVQSLTRARNIGIGKAKGKIIGFLDDDVTLDKSYLDNMIKIFNQNEKIKGVSGWYLPKIKIDKFENFIKRLFFIEHFEKNRTRVVSAYGATYPYKLEKNINSQWLSGFNMFFRKEVFNKIKFDENLKKYALAEDFDFTYRLYKISSGTLIITPEAKLIHRVSNVERMPTEKIAYMNQIHHFYLNYKNFNSDIWEKISFIWTLFGISFLRTLKFVKSRNKIDRLKLYYFVKSLLYTFKNLERIKKGNLEFKAEN